MDVEPRAGRPAATPTPAE